jgi:hypothetical protein
MGFYDNGEKAGASADGTVGAVHGDHNTPRYQGSSTRRMLSTLWGFATMGTRPGERLMCQLVLQLDRWTIIRRDIRGVQLTGSYQHTVGACDDGTSRGEWCIRRWGQVRCIRRWGQVRGISNCPTEMT